MNRWFLHAGYGWRLAITGWGIALLVWLPFEDTDPRTVLFFALAGGILAALRFTPLGRARRSSQEPTQPATSALRRLASYLLAGGLAGLASGPLGAALMLLKNGLHAHPTPDFGAAHVAAALVGTPVWAAAGILLGLGVGLLEVAYRLES